MHFSAYLISGKCLFKSVYFYFYVPIWEIQSWFIYFFKKNQFPIHVSEWQWINKQKIFLSFLLLFPKLPFSRVWVTVWTDRFLLSSFSVQDFWNKYIRKFCYKDMGEGEWIWISCSNQNLQQNKQKNHSLAGIYISGFLKKIYCSSCAESWAV